jgi:hypothetical protein
MKQRIGVLRLLKQHTYERHYECAAWYTRITVEPGDYEILAEVQPDGTVKDWPGAQLPGIITGSCFVSLFCGNRIPGTDSNTDKDVGKEDTYLYDWYAHTLAYFLLEEKHKEKWCWYEVTLDEGFLPTYVNFEYDGKPCQTAHLVKVADYKKPIVLVKLQKETL